MKWLAVLLLIVGLTLVGCVQESQGTGQPAVPNQSDAPIGPFQANQAIRTLTSDKCGSYVTFKGLTSAEDELLNDCYKREYLSRAEVESDVKICDEIYNPAIYGQCYGLVAAKRDDSSLCKRITNIQFVPGNDDEVNTTLAGCNIAYLYFSLKPLMGCPSCSLLTDINETAANDTNASQPPDG